MEQPKYHEIIPAVREIVRGIGEFVVEKIIPGEVFEEFMGSPRGASELLDSHLDAEQSDGQES